MSHPFRNQPPKFQTVMYRGQDQGQITAILKQAFALQQQGLFDRAQNIYQRVLLAYPNHVDALELQGLLFIQTGKFQDSLKFLNKAIKISPSREMSYSNRGNVFKELNRMDDALRDYDKAIGLNPKFAEAHSNRGNVLQELNRLDEALLSYDKAISLRPNYPEAYSNRGNVLKELRRIDEALQSYEKAINLRPGYAEAYSNRGNVLQSLKRFDLALSSFDKAIEINPNYAEAYCNRGITLHDKSQYAEALLSYDKAISLRPNYPEAYSNRGNVLKGLNRLDEALLSYDKAISLRPNYPEAYSNRGNVLKELRRIDEALQSYEKAINLMPENPEAYWNLSLCDLLRGDFQKGWLGYEYRWHTENGRKSLGARKYMQAQWSGKEALQGKTILLYAEQGIGDTIQFSRYIPMVIELGAKVILEVQRPLMGLLNDLGSNLTVVCQGDVVPDFDYHCPLMSLPLAFSTELNNIPLPSKSIMADERKVVEWESLLGPKNKPRIGLVWSGNHEHKNDHNRSIGLSKLLPYLPFGLDFICLQKDIREGDKKLLADSTQIRVFSERLQDFTDTAALCDLMDIVVTVDTSVAHLSGTLGKPTWILLPFNPDWRWLLDRGDTPWYPTLRLFRQKMNDDWGSVLSDLRGQLSNAVGKLTCKFDPLAVEKINF